MLRSILVALDDTPGAEAACDVAIDLARRTGAALTAAAVLDRPHIQDQHEPTPPGGAAFKERRDAALLRQAGVDAEAAFAACALAAGDLPFTQLILEDAPEPALLTAGAAHDLVVIGRDSTLGREENPDGLAPVIEALLKDGARPLLVVPPLAPLPRARRASDDEGATGAIAARLRDGEHALRAVTPTESGILVGYDGSIPAMRVLQLFALLGLDEGSPVRVLALGDSAAAAEAVAEQGASYLRRHGINARGVGAIGAKPVDALLAEASAMPARLLVAGAYGTTVGLRSIFFGSTTRRLLRDSPCPVFVHH